MAQESNNNGWQEYQRLVLDKLDSHGKWLRAIEANQRCMDRKLAQLQVKSSLWGGVAGAIVAIPALVVAWIMNK